MEPITTPPNPFITADGQLAIPSFEEVFFLPGDWLIYLLTSRLPAVADILGLSPADYGGTPAGFISWTSWVLFAIGAIALTAAVRRFDRALTAGLIDAVAELKRRVRMSIAFVRYRRRPRAERHEPTLDAVEATLSRNEVRALALHAKLAPGFALAISDVVEELDVRAHEIRAVLERLQQLKLLQSTIGGLDGDTAYTLTAAGRAFLRMHHARPKHA
jgi:hypothetical protein